MVTGNEVASEEESSATFNVSRHYGTPRSKRQENGRQNANDQPRYVQRRSHKETEFLLDDTAFLCR